MKKDIDNKKQVSNLLENTDIEAQVPSTVKDTEEYTVSPDGKYKFPKIKQKAHGSIIVDETTRIPYFDRPGYAIAWFTDEKPHELDRQRRRGYEFVDKDCPEAEGRELVIHAGYRVDGSPYNHYAMQIPLGHFKALKAAEHKELKDHELGQGLYATDQMKLGTGYQHGYLSKE
jgi:hypothetical protein